MREGRVDAGVARRIDRIEGRALIAAGHEESAERQGNQ